MFDYDSQGIVCVLIQAARSPNGGYGVETGSSVLFVAVLYRDKDTVGAHVLPLTGSGAVVQLKQKLEHLF